MSTEGESLRAQTTIVIERWALGVAYSALIERRYSLFALRLAQLSLGRFHIARRLLAK
jgi:hypothetical protein